MTRILLIRHGSTDLHNIKLCGRLPGISLSAEGLREVGALGERLQREICIDAVVSSPLERAVETARVIAESQDLSVAIDEGVNEMAFGDWTGLTFEKLHHLPEWRRYNHNRSLYRAPGGESLMDVQCRAWAALSRIVATNQETTAAVVTHADVIRALLVLLLGMPGDHLLRLNVQPASVTDVSLGGDYPVINGINIVASHLR